MVQGLEENQGGLGEPSGWVSRCFWVVFVESKSQISQINVHRYSQQYASI
jgi:hypothetical protein